MAETSIDLGHGLQFNLRYTLLGHKYKDDEVIDKHGGYVSYLYIAQNISDNNGNVLAKYADIDFFIELINAFLSSQLIHGKTYEKAGFKARIATKEKVQYLQIAITGGNTIYLEKLDCRVLSNKLRRIWQKCIDAYMQPNDIANILLSADVPQ